MKKIYLGFGKDEDCFCIKSFKKIIVGHLKIVIFFFYEWDFHLQASVNQHMDGGRATKLLIF
jgi:hypothetical protein